MRREKEAGTRLSGWRQRNKEEKEGGKNSSDTCECDRRFRKVEKAKRPKLKEYEKIWAIRKRWRWEPKLWAGQGSRGVRRSEWAQQLYLEQDILRGKPICLFLSLSFCVLNSHSGHSGEERCNLSLKTPEKTKVPDWGASLTSIIGHRDRQQKCWPDVTWECLGVL